MSWIPGRRDLPLSLISVVNARHAHNIDLNNFLLSEKAMAPHSSTLAWHIPWTEEPGGLQSMGSLRVGHDWATSLSLFTFMHWRRKLQPSPVFLPLPRTGDPGGLPSVGYHRVRHDWSNLTVGTNEIIHFVTFTVRKTLNYSFWIHMFFHLSREAILLSSVIWLCLLTTWVFTTNRI